MKHSPSSSGDLGSSLSSVGLLDWWTFFGLWLFSSVAASHCWFVYSTPQRTMIFCLFCFFNSLHCLFGSSSRSLLADGGVLLGRWVCSWCEVQTLRARSVPSVRLVSSGLGRTSLSVINQQTSAGAQKKNSEKRLEIWFKLKCCWVESEAGPASERSRSAEARRP